MSEQITLAELCKWWNPVNNRPADTTRFGPLMTKAWHQVENKRIADEEAARKVLEPAPDDVVAPVAAAPVRRPKRRPKVEAPEE